MAPAVGFEPTGPLLNINDLAPNTHLYTHSDCVELTEIIEKWPKLPKEIRDAILAIVRSAKWLIQNNLYYILIITLLL